MYDFLSHLSGDEVSEVLVIALSVFLSHLSGDEVDADCEKPKN